MKKCFRKPPDQHILLPKFQMSAAAKFGPPIILFSLRDSEGISDHSKQIGSEDYPRFYQDLFEAIVGYASHIPHPGAKDGASVSF